MDIDFDQLPSKAYAPETDLGYGRVEVEILDLAGSRINAEYVEGCRAGKSRLFSLKELTLDFDGRITLSDYLRETSTPKP